MPISEGYRVGGLCLSKPETGTLRRYIHNPDMLDAFVASEDHIDSRNKLAARESPLRVAPHGITEVVGVGPAIAIGVVVESGNNVDSLALAGLDVPVLDPRDSICVETDYADATDYQTG